jgi:flagellar hook-associated protein 1 FlgK
MGLNGALDTGRSGLLSAQKALQTAGNNLSNAATKGYHRQRASLSAAPTVQDQANVRLGTGVQVDSVTREVDQAVEARLRGAMSDHEGSAVRQELLGQVEAIHNSLADNSLSDRLTAFFDNWDELANNPEDTALRTTLTEQASSLSEFVQQTRGELTNLRRQVRASVDESVNEVNKLLGQVEELNDRIASSEGSGGEAMSLRDERGRVLEKLSEQIDISTQSRHNGQVDVYVGSEPLVLNGDARPVEIQRRERDGEEVRQLVVKDNQAPLAASSGKLASRLDFEQNDLKAAIGTLDEFAQQLIYQVNRKHSQGQGLELIGTTTSEHHVGDATAALDSDDADLAHDIEHGSFKLHVTQTSTGQRQTHQINVDLDQVDPANNTSLQDLANQINAAGNVSASVTSDDRLKIDSGDDFAVSFTDDTSGALAGLGVNGFFAGEDASDIAVDQTVRQRPARVAASGNHHRGNNDTARAISGLREEKVTALGEASLSDHWHSHVEQIAADTAEAKQQTEADNVVRENLSQQQQAISGVNVDEQTIDLMQSQRAFQASARFITTVDELMTTLLQSV